MNSDFEKYLAENIEEVSGNIPVPSELSPSEIEEQLLVKKEESIKKTPVFSWRRLTAVTCAFAMLVVGVVGIYPMLRKEACTDTVPSSSSENTVTEEAKNYDEVIAALKEAYEANPANYIEYDTGIEETEAAAPATPSYKAGNSPSGGATATADSSYGTTNIQVDGVDEDDIIKTDGEYIYTLTYTDSGQRIFSITRAVPADDMQVVYQEEFEEFSPDGMYLVNGKIILTGQQLYTPEEGDSDREDMIDPLMDRYIAPYYHYPTTSTYEVRFIDVSNPSAPELERRFQQDGNIMSSRLTGGQLYLITQKSVLYSPDKEEDLEQLIPSVGDSLGTGSTNCEKTIIPASCIAIGEDLTDSNYVLISALSIDNMEQEAVTKSYLGTTDRIYCDNEALYLLSPAYEYVDAEGKPVEAEVREDGFFQYPVNTVTLPFTDIVRFYLNNGQIEMDGKGRVPGTTSDQFAMDTYDGYFRIVTTVSIYNYVDYENTTSNNIYILNKELDIEGKVEGMAPGEYVYSVRLMGDRGYIVTFKQIDPLFALDLSDPKNPKVTGELKIPGFSEYLHPLNDNTLIGIGMSATEEGRTTGVKISLFDVSDPFDPKEVHAVEIEDTSYAEALYNHKAVIFDSPRGLLGFSTYYYDRHYVEGTTYRVYSVSEEGFEELAQLKSGEHSRGTYIDDCFYVCSDDFVRSYSMNDFQLIKEVSLAS